MIATRDETTLLPCPGCRRHVRHDERRCPFCEVGLRIGRASVGGFVLIASALIGCRGEKTEIRKDQPTTTVRAADAQSIEDAQSAEDEARKKAEEELKEALKKKAELERAKPVYGGPPPRPKPTGSGDAGAPPCPPGNPLCP